MTKAHVVVVPGTPVIGIRRADGNREHHTTTKAWKSLHWELAYAPNIYRVKLKSRDWSAFEVEERYLRRDPP